MSSEAESEGSVLMEAYRHDNTEITLNQTRDGGMSELQSVLNKASTSAPSDTRSITNAMSAFVSSRGLSFIFLIYYYWLTEF